MAIDCGLSLKLVIFNLFLPRVGEECLASNICLSDQALSLSCSKKLITFSLLTTTYLEVAFIPKKTKFIWQRLKRRVRTLLLDIAIPYREYAT